MNIQIKVANYFKYHIFMVFKESELIETLFFDENGLNYGSLAYLELNNKLLSVNSFYAENSLIKNALVLKNKGILEKSLLAYCSKIVAGKNKMPLFKKGLVLNGFFTSLKYNEETKNKGFITLQNFKKEELNYSLEELKHNDYILEFNKNILNHDIEKVKNEVKHLSLLLQNIINGQKNILLLQQNPLLAILQKYNVSNLQIVFADFSLQKRYFCNLVANIITKEQIIVDSQNLQNTLSNDLKNEIIALEDKEVFASKDLNINLHETEDFSYFDLNGNAKTPTKFNLNALKKVKDIIYKRAISGQIIVDTVNLRQKEDKIEFLHKARELFAQDSDIKVFSITRLGLLEISRKRTLQSMQNIFCEATTTLNNKAIEAICFNHIKATLLLNPIANINCYIDKNVYKNLVKTLNKQEFLQVSFKVDQSYKGSCFKVF